MKPIRWGIAGLGNIAHKFASDLALVSDCFLQAVASSDGKRAKKFLTQFAAKDYYSNYSDLFSDPNVDIIYIASLHTLHKSLSIKAMKQGKAVLCEKPMAMNQIEVREMIKTAKENNVFLMEALWTRFNPAFEQVNLWVKENKIGPLRYINSTFSFNAFDKGVDSRIFNPKKGGGSLLDIGIYPIFLAYHFLGFPADIKASAVLTKEKVDEQIGFIFSYSGAQAILYSSFTHNEDMRATICGENGEIYMNSQWHHTPNVQLINDGKEMKKSFHFLGTGYTYEIEEANNCIRNNKLESSKWSWKNSEDVVTLMDVIRKKVGVIYPTDKEQLRT
jgi:predicted dehydrogenase